MLTYSEMKKALEAAHQKTTYFTQDFYKAFIEAQNKLDWNDIFYSRFYRKNSCAYCAFLEIFHENNPEFTFDILDEYGYCVSAQKVKAFNLDQAKKEAENIKNYHFSDNYTIKFYQA